MARKSTEKKKAALLIMVQATEMKKAAPLIMVQASLLSIMLLTSLPSIKMERAPLVNLPFWPLCPNTTRFPQLLQTKAWIKSMTLKRWIDTVPKKIA